MGSPVQYVTTRDGFSIAYSQSGAGGLTALSKHRYTRCKSEFEYHGGMVG